MPFIPKLPTWHNIVTFYRLTDDVWEEAGQCLGQLYTPLRNQDDEQGGLMYFEFPKAQLPSLAPWLFPRDSFNGVADVAEFDLPGSNGRQAYRVREVRGRWTGFPNEHLLCDMQRMASHQWDLVNHQAVNDPPPAPPLTPPTSVVPPADIDVAGVVDDACDACGELNGNYGNLVYKGLLPNNGWPIHYWESPAFSWSCSPTGMAFWRISELNPLVVGGVVTIAAALMYAHPTLGPLVIVEAIETRDPWDGTAIELTDIPSTSECDFSAATITISFAIQYWHVNFNELECIGCAEGSENDVYFDAEPVISPDHPHWACGGCEGDWITFADGTVFWDLVGSAPATVFAGSCTITEHFGTPPAALTDRVVYP